MRTIRRAVAAATLLIAPFVVLKAAPAEAIICHDGQSCDCSVYVLKKKIIHCDQ